jgi:hypothetical protein
VAQKWRDAGSDILMLLPAFSQASREGFGLSNRRDHARKTVWAGREVADMNVSTTTIKILWVKTHYSIKHDPRMSALVEGVGSKFLIRG